MGIGTIIGVVLGLVLIYSLLSIIVTQINTLIVNALKLRANTLRKGISELISDPAVRAQVLTHPLVRVVNPSLSERVEETVRSGSAEQVRSMSAAVTTTTDITGVTWVEPKIFTDAVFDILRTNAERRLYDPFYDIAKQIRDNAVREQVNDLICQLSTNNVSIEQFRVETEAKLASEPVVFNDFMEKLAELREVRESILRQSHEGSLIPLLEGVSQLSEDSNTRKALTTLIASAQTVEAATEKVEYWFDKQMERLSESYKRNMGWLTIGVGFLLALVLNVDTVQLARSLWENPTLNALVVSFAEQNAAQITPTDGAASSTDLTAQDVTEQAVQGAINALNRLTSLNLPIGWYDTRVVRTSAQAAGFEENACTPTQQNVVVSDAPAQATPEATADAAFSAQADNLVTEEAPFITDNPEGTDISEGSTVVSSPSVLPTECTDRRNLALLLPWSVNFDFSALFVKILGLLITTIAIGQGAPFWFDLLNRLVRGG